MTNYLLKVKAESILSNFFMVSVSGDIKGMLKKCQINVDCPMGLDSWCSYIRDLATGEFTHRPIKNPLRPVQ